MKNKFILYNQHDSMDCGPTCLKMVIKHYGKNIQLSRIRELCFITRSGTSLLGISDAAETLGFHSIGASITYDQLINEVPLPCIAHWRDNHFVVIYKIRTSRWWSFLNKKKAKEIIYIADPEAGLLKYKPSEFKNAWISAKNSEQPSGKCLLLEPTPSFYENEDEDQKSGLSYLLSFLRPYKSLILQLFFGFLIGSIIALINPFLTQAIIDKGINFQDFSFLLIILISQLFLAISSSAALFLRSWISLHLSTRLNISLLANFLMHLMKLPVNFFDKKNTGDIMQRISDNERVQLFLTSSIIGMIYSILNFVIFGAIIAFYSAIVFSIFIAGSILYIFWITAFLKSRRKLDIKRFIQQSNSQSNIIQLITGMQEIKLNNCEKQKRWEWEQLQASSFKISFKSLMIGQYQEAGALLINSLKNFIITYVVAKAVINGEMSLGMMLSIQFIIGQLNPTIESFITFIQGWQDAKMSLERLNEIQSKEIENSDLDQKVLELPIDRDIHIKNLSFQYDGRRSPLVLKEINLVIPSKKITAIVGESGSGKTTLLKLLLGFYPITKGEINIGSTALSTIHTSTWRKNTGTVMQDGFIFSDTIAKNIAISDDIINKDKLLNALKVSNLLDYVSALPNGLNTKIGESGNGISQGQKQRILIARSIYKNPEYIFFDEATNALDANNELQIINNLNSFFDNKTVVVVAHRLSTVKNAHNIVVIDNGEIVEQGTHDELLTLKNFYYNLIKNQIEIEPGQILYAK